jgi:hypothetical protein
LRSTIIDVAKVEWVFSFMRVQLLRAKCWRRKNSMNEKTHSTLATSIIVDLNLLARIGNWTGAWRFRDIIGKKLQHMEMVMD